MDMIGAIIALFSWGLLIIIPKDAQNFESFKKEMQKSIQIQAQNVPSQVPERGVFNAEKTMNMLGLGMAQIPPQQSHTSQENGNQSIQMQTSSMQSIMGSFSSSQEQGFNMNDMMSDMIPDMPSVDASSLTSGMGGNSIPGLNVITITSQGISAHSTLPGQSGISLGTTQTEMSESSE